MSNPKITDFRVSLKMARQPGPSHGDSSHKLSNRNNEDMLMSDDESVGSDLEDLNDGRTGQYKDDAQDSSFNVDDLDN